MNNLIHKLFIIIVLVLFVSSSVVAKEKPASLQYKKTTIKLNNCTILVEVADNQQLRAKGLSNRKNLEPDAGMLFVFPYPDYYSFWMKDMNFPLDFIWIKDGQIVDITHNVPYPAGPIRDLPSYTPTSPVNYMLEVNAGIADKCGVKIGDKISLPDEVTK